MGVASLSENERAAAEEALLYFARNVPEYWSSFGSAIGALHNELNNGSPISVVLQALQLCEGAHDTLPMINLLGLVRELQGIPSIITRLECQASLSQASVDPFDQTIMFTRAPFVGRFDIRTALQALLGPAPKQPFIVVNGDTKLGKSYTSEFIGHVLFARNNVRHCVVELPKGSGAGIGPLELTRELVASMGGKIDYELLPTTNAEALYKEMINLIIATGASSGQQWWIVLDGFTRDELRKDTQDLIIRLAKRLTNGIPQQRFRLILLDFDRTLLPVQPGMVMIDTLSSVPKTAVERFVIELFGSRIGNFGLNETVSELIEGLPTAGLGDEIFDLPELAARLGGLIAAVETRK